MPPRPSAAARELSKVQLKSVTSKKEVPPASGGFLAELKSKSANISLKPTQPKKANSSPPIDPVAAAAPTKVASAKNQKETPPATESDSDWGDKSGDEKSKHNEVHNLTDVPTLQKEITRLSTENERLKARIASEESKNRATLRTLDDSQLGLKRLSEENASLQDQIEKMSVAMGGKKIDSGDPEKVEQLEKKVKTLEAELQKVKNKESKSLRSDDSDDEGWDTGTPERRQSPINDKSSSLSSKGLEERLARVERERDDAVKKLKKQGALPPTLSSDELSNLPPKDKYTRLLEAELAEAKREKEKALKFVIDMVGVKRFEAFLNEGNDLRSLKRIVRTNISGSPNKSSPERNGSPDIKPRLGQGAWWSTRYMDEVRTEKSARRAPRNSPSSPTNGRPANSGMREIHDDAIKDPEAYREYKKYMKIAQMQNAAALQHKPIFHGSGRRQTYFSNMRDSHNVKVASAKSVGGVGKSAIIKATEAYKKAAGW
jgi:hypothetical protein